MIVKKMISFLVEFKREKNILIDLYEIEMEMKINYLEDQTSI
jgi:hypothetical protein